MARQMLMSSRFLHGELPIRLAHRIIELNALPEELSQNLHVERVKAWYAESFHDLRALPLVKEEADVVRFTELLRRLYARHGPVVPAVAKGVEEYKRQALQAGRSESGLQADLDPFLDRFFLSRIALRFLVGHHIALYEQSVKPEGQRRMDRIGMIHTKCSPLQVSAGQGEAGWAAGGLQQE
ncbi:protein-serine/threonine kinase [Haematococcus lacustris]|uniref:Protein-serine/threonine kinase n=1 Tax=Haematococcus lacustris TaxID=44745 RepID=A0A699Z046_HAELA|nr:protein-serine/threonine kinase [Haematococcus lacustris]